MPQRMLPPLPIFLFLRFTYTMTILILFEGNIQGRVERGWISVRLIEVFLVNDSFSFSFFSWVFCSCKASMVPFKIKGDGNWFFFGVGWRENPVILNRDYDFSFLISCAGFWSSLRIFYQFLFSKKGGRYWMIGMENTWFGMQRFFSLGKVKRDTIDKK